MRLAVIADTHLGFKYGTERGEDAFINAADAFKKALACQPDYILLLGDIFDHRVAKPEVLNKAMQLFKHVNASLRKSGRADAIISIYGTHETRHKDAINPVQLLAQAGLLKLLHKSSVLLEKHGQKVTVFGMSGVHDSFAKAELLAWNPQPAPGAFNIMLLHQTFKEDIPQAEASVAYQNLPAGFNLFLFGHIHYVHERSIGAAPVIYPGSTVRTQLGKNTTTNLGFYILEIDSNQLVKKEFVTLDSPRDFIHITLDISNNSPAEIISSLTTKIEQALGGPRSKKPLVKVKLVGKLKIGFTPSDLQLAPVLKRFKDACFLKIDKTSLESERAKERLKFLADLGQKQESIESLGIDLLCRNLKETGLSKSKVAELFEQLSSGEIEVAEELLSVQKVQKLEEGKSIGADAVSKTQESEGARGASWQDTFKQNVK